MKICIGLVDVRARACWRVWQVVGDEDGGEDGCVDEDDKHGCWDCSEGKDGCKNIQDYESHVGLGRCGQRRERVKVGPSPALKSRYAPILLASIARLLIQNIHLTLHGDMEDRVHHKATTLSTNCTPSLSSARFQTDIQLRRLSRVRSKEATGTLKAKAR